MATQALIRINGVNAPHADHLDLPIDTLVQLANVGLGGESTYLWEILDQPPGTTDVLSSTTIASPTFTPTKEGTYLLELTVNAGLATEKVTTAVAAVLQLKSLERVPAAGESTEAGSSSGWALSVNSQLRRLDAFMADPGTVIAVAGSAGLVFGSIVRLQGVATIKAGLPGEEVLPKCILATNTDIDNVDETLGVLISGVDGDTTPAEDDLVIVRLQGVIGPVTVDVGMVIDPNDIIGTPVYANSSGFLIDASPPSGYLRQIGHVLYAVSGGGTLVTITTWFDGALNSPTQTVKRLEIADGGNPNEAAPAGWARLIVDSDQLQLSLDGGDFFPVGMSLSGTATLVGGTVGVSNVLLTANSRIQVTRNTPGGTIGDLSAPSASRATGVSGNFVINSDNVLDTSTVDWTIHYS